MHAARLDLGLQEVRPVRSPHVEKLRRDADGLRGQCCEPLVDVDPAIDGERFVIEAADRAHDPVLLQLELGLGAIDGPLEDRAPQPELATEHNRLLGEEAVLATRIVMAGLDLFGRETRSGIRPRPRLTRPAARGIDPCLCGAQRGVVLDRQALELGEGEAWRRRRTRWLWLRG